MALERDRFRGALRGLAVGDALGTTVEFKPSGTFERVTDMVGGGPFGLPVGAWTDDTSMALCLAESLVKRAGFDPVDQLGRYVRWYREGHWSSTGTCFDIGNATRAALERFERTREPYPGDADPGAAGNGPLMKLAPIALAYARDPARAVRYAGLSARTTHGAPEAVDASRYFAALLVGALEGRSKQELIGGGAFGGAELHPTVAAVANGSFRDKEPPAVRGGGYVVEALEAALWALHSTNSFEDGVLAAVNLGDDADTTAAIFGQLAGAIYGVDAIPERWRRQLVMGDKIVEVADALHRLSETIGAEPGPVDGSLWVHPRRLAGPSPASPEELDALVAAGVTTLVGVSDGVPNTRHDRLHHLQIPVLDDGVKNDWRLIVTLTALQFSLGSDEVVYLHGDDGRTGMVLACLLIGNGAPATEILHLLSTLRARSPQPRPLPPPDDVHRRLEAGGPVVIERANLRVQALAERDERMVRVEVLDPVFWKLGPPLDHDFDRLGLQQEEGMWAHTTPGGAEALNTAAELIDEITRLSP